MSENISYTPVDWGMMIRALEIMAFVPGDNDTLIEKIRGHVKPPSHAPVAIEFVGREIEMIKMAEHFAFPSDMAVRTPERGYE